MADQIVADGTRPALSVVVVVVSDTTSARAEASRLDECLEALESQTAAPSIETIVPYCVPLDGIEAVRRRHPGVRFVEVSDLSHARRIGSREHHDELRARGLALATGAIVGLLEDHARPDPGWAAAAVSVHRGPHAGVGGAIENGLDRALNWAVYFCDFARYQNPLPAGETTYASDANACYKRAALDEIRDVWAESFNETRVNAALLERGQRLALTPALVVCQNRAGLRLGPAIRERFVWGRSYAGTRTRLLSRGRRVVYAALSPVLPPLLVGRMAAGVWQRKRHVGAFLRALPHLVLLTSSWAAGELSGYVTGRAASVPSGHAAPPGSPTPQRTAV